MVQTSNYSLSDCFSHYPKIQTMLLLPVITSLSHHSKVGQHLVGDGVKLKCLKWIGYIVS